MGVYTPDKIVIACARAHSPRELCEKADAAHNKGEDDLLYLDALAVHARREGWIELLMQSLFGWEDDVGP
ncbi:hypothetical protein G7068_11885 [Leucobacter viscericola]|uniref:Uncharacterized protein n=1 Tax=Leucobacter viscericola TaxID=2714935 RepID=A0A6G7XH85_9MICO|nr:hypothetical protein [Leucobacter viscericola]QIK63809.1 hypothetical protein G7068_11885 [Leucobacter viscericola]